MRSVSLALLVLALASGAAAESGWKAPRNAFGQPDLQGVWANNIATPLERPEALAGRETLTDAELAAIRQRAESLFGLDSDDAAFGDSVFNLALNGAESFTSTDAATGNYNQFWVAERDWDNRTSLIVDPPNGRLPPLTDEGEKRAAALRAARNARAAGPEDRSLTERCISFGVPRLRAAYNSYTQIFQGEDHVVLHAIDADGTSHCMRRSHNRVSCGCKPVATGRSEVSHGNNDRFFLRRFLDRLPHGFAGSSTTAG